MSLQRFLVDYLHSTCMFTDPRKLICNIGLDGDEVAKNKQKYVFAFIALIHRCDIERKKNVLIIR